MRLSDFEIFIKVLVLFEKVMLDAPHLVVLVNLLYVALDVGLLAESLVALLAPELQVLEVLGSVVLYQLGLLGTAPLALGTGVPLLVDVTDVRSCFDKYPIILFLIQYAPALVLLTAL